MTAPSQVGGKGEQSAEERALAIRSEATQRAFRIYSVEVIGELRGRLERIRAACMGERELIDCMDDTEALKRLSGECSEALSLIGE